MTMEDVWKDISLASLCDHSSPAAAGSSAARNDPAAVRGFIFQDFMAAASTKLAPSSLATDLAPPPPVTLLSLSSSGSDHFQQYQVHNSSATTSTNTSGPPTLAKQNPQRLQSDSSRPSSSLISFSNKSTMEALDSSQYCKKRAIEEENRENSRHVRHKRMIKNRESASRSRARKQAYTSELELKLEHLKEENARLKLQQKKFCLATTPVAPSTRLKRAHTV